MQKEKMIAEHYKTCKPSEFNAVREAVLIGNMKYFRSTFFAEVFKHIGVEPKPLDETEGKPLFALLWMNGIRGDGWGWTYDGACREIETLRQKWPDIKVFGNVDVDDDKLVVQQNFEDIFGYNLEVNPITHVGPVVMKSRVQARHDGKVVTCPLMKIEPNSVYQIDVNNRLGEHVVDIRVVIIDQMIPYVYLKYRPFEKRFSDVNEYIKIVPPHDVLSPLEIDKILKYAKLSKLELGELDVLRDNNSGLIYIVDLNNTPSGVLANISESERALAKGLISSALLDSVQHSGSMISS